ncbi:hypothetical protein XENOCAPTIV_030010 [Xenoophorus captivus]|uniref:Uncharacterized protein n=1 Tax=Xenoophorus captivus TaxID=1517983 RepID=A0ABV0SC78_9TELE
MQITCLLHLLYQTDRTVISRRSPPSQNPRAHKSKPERRDLRAAAAVLDGTPSSIMSSFPHGRATQQPQRFPPATSFLSSSLSSFFFYGDRLDVSCTHGRGT